MRGAAAGGVSAVRQARKLRNDTRSEADVRGKVVRRWRRCGKRLCSELDARIEAEGMKKVATSVGVGALKLKVGDRGSPA